MCGEESERVSAGPYTGRIEGRYRDPEFLSAVADLAAAVAGPDSVVLTAGRNRNVRIALPCRGRTIPVAVKSFGRQGALRDCISRFRGSKAERTWRAAAALRDAGVGTPAPIGFLERRQGGRLVESYYLAEYIEQVSSFRGELIRLVREDPECSRFMALLQTVAAAIRAMHDARFRHNDLGNQNILLRQLGPEEWGDVMFIDLNRARFGAPLSLRERARDLSRIYLPSDLLRVFKEMYWGDKPPPRAFQRWERLHRGLYAIHAGTRRLRHPLRERRRPCGDEPDYPPEPDMWIWDERSGQAVSALMSRSRRRHYPPLRNLRIAAAALSGLAGVRREYRALLAQCYRSEVPLANRLGIAISPRRDTVSRELALLERLGKIPVFLRFYCHESQPQRAFAAGVVKDLRRAGYPVSIALVQDRLAVLNPGRWTAFAEEVLAQVAECVDTVEIGHAVNRVKWGIWSPDEYGRLVRGVAEAAARFPQVRFTGPAAIDFEYPFVMAALRTLPRSFRFAALSHHLYVDRRGAPESRQGSFSCLEKFALARAIARWSPSCDDRLIVSEVNWPLLGTGVYSPVGSPYESPGPRFNDPSVSEDDYADYMIRYLCHAVCSGMVHQVFWWRLVARGFGLVDDTEPGAWRERPAYRMFRQFLSLAGSAAFVARLDIRPDEWCLLFRRADGETIGVAFSSAGERRVRLPLACRGVEDAFGLAVRKNGDEVAFSGRPVYLRGVSPERAAEPR